MFNNIKTGMTVVILSTLLSACASNPPELADFKPLVRPVAPPQESYDNGSLFQGRGIALFEDPKPYRVGDILTIILEESTSASKNADTSTKKDEDVSIDIPTIFGTTPTHEGNQLWDLSMSPTREFEGEAESSQSNSLSGEITVTVVDVLQNGNLVVQGEKWFTLNQGKEYIRVAGVIRPQDIQSDNTITSSKLADAQIAYSGEGFVADSNKQGWFTRFLSSEWWPF